MLSAAPPRASPSSLVKTSAVSGRRRETSRPLGTASLASHGVDHEQDLPGLRGGRDLRQLGHHRGVSVLAAGAVHDDHISLRHPQQPGLPGLTMSSGAVPAEAWLRTGTPTCSPEADELLDGSGAIHVGCHQRGMPPLYASGAPGQLSG